ncbi:MAG: hypothetical protein QHI38_09365 [Armatimonadota bacterium]|nr:hypothetical protein [Armatimonadota bacterium]
MKSLLVTIWMSVLCGSLVAGDAQPVGPGITDASAVTAKTQTSAKEPGRPATDVIRGNGTRAGYILAHGNVVPGSEWVYVGVKRAVRNVDYTIDYASGSLFFAEPVRQCDSVKVDYRYVESANGERTVSGLGGLPFNIGTGLQTNLTYSYRAADSPAAGTPDILTYGLNSTLHIGASSTISGLAYVSAPQFAERKSLRGSQTGAQPQQGNAAVNKDHIIVQDADFSLGKTVRLKLGFQDVGEGFAGFKALREAHAVKDDILSILQKEKGIQRSSAALQVPFAGAGGLSFSMGRISDKADSISSFVWGLDTGAFKLNMLTREVGAQFSRFNDLRESDRGQLAAEAGIKRTQYDMSFVSGSRGAADKLWSSVRFVRLEGETGSLTYQSADLDLGSLKVHADAREADPGFGKMIALSDEERTRMALIARRQFDPAAQASQVSAEDKAQVAKEVGLDRRNIGLEWAGAPGKAWLRLSSVNSGSGGLVRKDISFEGKGYSLYFAAQSIDEGFDRFAQMQAVEKARYGRESGMRRHEAGGKFKLSFGDLSVAHAAVSDCQGAGVVRDSLQFVNPRLSLRANFQSIDPEFTRIADLSDADRAALAQEKGFTRYDYSLKFQASRSLLFDTYVYDSTHQTAGQTRSQKRYAVTYTPQQGPKITALSDDYSYVSESGTVAGYLHRRITFDNKLALFNGLLFQGLHDTNDQITDDSRFIRTEITQTHLESDQSARTSYTIDTLRKDFGENGRFEDSWGVGIKTSLAQNLKLTGGYIRTAREADNSESNTRLGIDWRIRSDLSLSFSMANRDGGPQGSQQSRQFALKGLLAKRFLGFEDVKVDSGLSETQLKGNQIACDNGLKINARFLGGTAAFDNSDKLNPKNGIYYTSRIVQYQSDPNPEKKYHLNFFRQNLITPAGTPARKRNLAFDMKLSQTAALTLTSYVGKDGQNGAVLPLAGTVLKLTRRINPGMNFVVDFSSDANELTARRARTFGFGINGTLSNSAQIELYTGWCRLFENGSRDRDKVFRIKYDHKMDADHFITLTAQRKSVVEKSSINPFEGNTTAQLDFRTVFN